MNLILIWISKTIILVQNYSPDINILPLPKRLVQWHRQLIERRDRRVGQTQRGLRNEPEDIQRRGDVEGVHIHRLVTSGYFPEKLEIYGDAVSVLQLIGSEARRELQIP